MDQPVLLLVQLVLHQLMVFVNVKLELFIQDNVLLPVLVDMEILVVNAKLVLLIVLVVQAKHLNVHHV